MGNCRLPKDHPGKHLQIPPSLEDDVGPIYVDLVLLAPQDMAAKVRQMMSEA